MKHIVKTKVRKDDAAKELEGLADKAPLINYSAKGKRLKDSAKKSLHIDHTVYARGTDSRRLAYRLRKSGVTTTEEIAAMFRKEDKLDPKAALEMAEEVYVSLRKDGALTET